MLKRFYLQIFLKNRCRYYQAGIFLLTVIFLQIFNFSLKGLEAKPNQVLIKEVKIDNEQKQLEILIDSKSEFKPFILENPDRLVIDIKNAKFKPSSKNSYFLYDQTGIVKSGKIGILNKNEQEFLRITLTLSKKITIQNSRFQKIKNDNFSKIIVKLDGNFDKKIKNHAKKIILSANVKEIQAKTVIIADKKEVVAEKDLTQLIDKIEIKEKVKEFSQKKNQVIKKENVKPVVKTEKIILADGSIKYIIKKYSKASNLEVGFENKVPVLSPNFKSKLKKIPVIVIDAGHGGKDPGTIGSYARSREKNITLAYAKELYKQLNQTKKYRVYLTRNNDVFISLRQRVERARKVKADLFISLHANSAANKKVSGLSIYTLSENASDKQAELLAQKENRADIIAGVNFSDASPDIMKTLIDLSQRDSMNNSARYANLVMKSAQISNIEILNNSHRFAGFRVLTAPDMVSVLIELGYLSNRYEEKKLNNFEYRKKLTAIMVKSINWYFET
jgi:N-acetylmuramoyl-L-alanine amidase